MSFSGGLFGAREPQDYDNDAIMVHMGCFDVPDAHIDEHAGELITRLSVVSLYNHVSSPTLQIDAHQHVRQCSRREYKSICGLRMAPPMLITNEWAREIPGCSRCCAVHPALYQQCGLCTATAGGQSSDSESDNPTAKEGGLEVTLVSRTASKARMARIARRRALRHKLHLYSIAAPGMRKWPDASHCQGLSRRLCWADPVNVKPGWQQTQKGYFEAPSE